MPVQRQFYRDIQKWISGGMGDHPIFRKGTGLCFTYRYWSRQTGNKIHNIGTRYRDWETDRKSTRLNSSHSAKSRMPSSA